MGGRLGWVDGDYPDEGGFEINKNMKVYLV